MNKIKMSTYLTLNTEFHIPFRRSTYPDINCSIFGLLKIFFIAKPDTFLQLCKRNDDSTKYFYFEKDFDYNEFRKASFPGPKTIHASKHILTLQTIKVKHFKF